MAGTHFKSPNPLTDAEKKRVEDDFISNSRKLFPKFAQHKRNLTSFLDATVHGVWINGKKIDNAELKKYSAEDFGEFTISPLMKNAANYGKHIFQVALTKKDGC